MKKKDESKERRAFLGKLTLGSIGLAMSAFVTNSKTVEENKKQMSKIKRVKAMGFQWETIDPFLFCVHHEDK